MEWSNGGLNKDGVPLSAGKKRPREPQIVEQSGVDDKKGCGEPFSWWTRLMLGVSERQSRVINRPANS